MTILGSFMYRILCCAILCGIVLTLFPEGRIKGLIRTLSGIFLVVIILTPFVDLELPSFEGIYENYLQQAQSASAVGEDYSRERRLEFIKEGLEAYILDKASRIGCELSVSVELDGEGYPVSVTFWGDIKPDAQKTLETVLSEELGIAKEDQQWNGLQTQQHFVIP